MLRFYRFEFRVFRVTKEFFDSFVSPSHPITILANTKTSYMGENKRET